MLVSETYAMGAQSQALPIPAMEGHGAPTAGCRSTVGEDPWEGRAARCASACHLGNRAKQRLKRATPLPTEELGPSLAQEPRSLVYTGGDA